MTRTSRVSLLALAATLLVATAAAVAWWPFDADGQILTALYQQRPAGWRLYRSMEAASRVPDEALLARAQVHALAVTDPAKRARIQSLIDLAQGHWPEATTILTRLHDASPNDPEILNDLAIALLAVAPDQAINYFKALELLEKARKLDPSAPAPAFNILRTYRTLRLGQAAEDLMAEYGRLEKEHAWLDELTLPPPDESPLIDALQNALKGGDTEEASRLLHDNAAYYRRAATEFAMIPEDREDSDPIAQYVAEHLRSEHRDETISAMLAPLRGGSRQAVLESRRKVRAGAQAYLEGRFEDSYAQYDLAESALKGVDSAFDRAWIDLNRTDTDIFTGQYKRARPALERLIPELRKNQFQWLLGQALAARGSNVRLTNDFLVTENSLTESLTVLRDIGAIDNIARPLYYMALWRSIGGDSEGSLDDAMRSLRLTRAADHVRLTQVFWVIGRSLLRAGFSKYAVDFQKESVREAAQANNSILVASSTADLASVYRAAFDYAEADKYLSRAVELGEKLDPQYRPTLDFALDVLCGRIQVGRKNPGAAAKCLERTIDNLRKRRQSLMPYLAPALTLLAQAETLRGDVARARKLFEEAADVVESDDDYLVTERSRLPFENERRDLYESAISFEYANNGNDAAWSYMQRYRSKLFLEFLGQVNPAVAKIHRDTIRRDAVQKLIPPDLQVVEYFVLKNQLLIWVESRDGVHPFMVSIDRESLEGKVGDVVSRIRNRQDVSKELTELYNYLIAPVEQALDPRRAVAIIPDQVLHRLPFDALRHGASGTYLIERYTILESPNLTTLLASSGSAPERGFALSYGSQGTGSTPVGAEGLALDDFYFLSRHRELDDVAREEFLESLSLPSILHYGGHSVDAPDPLNAKILLDGEDGGPNSVTAADISRQRMLPNAVVILASCDSSLGNSRDGVGLRGLTSAFLIAGAGTVAGSLWPVEEASTASLMRSFHENFAMNVSAAEAMRQAQVSFISRNPKMAHPYYWSGFVVNGNLSAMR